MRRYLGIQGVDDEVYIRMRHLAIAKGVTMGVLLRELVELGYKYEKHLPDKAQLRKMRKFTKTIKFKETE